MVKKVDGNELAELKNNVGDAEKPGKMVASIPGDRARVRKVGANEMAGGKIDVNIKGGKTGDAGTVLVPVVGLGAGACDGATVNKLGKNVIVEAGVCIRDTVGLFEYSYSLGVLPDDIECIVADDAAYVRFVIWIVVGEVD